MKEMFKNAAIAFRKEADEIETICNIDLAILGDKYKDTLEYNSNRLRIEWLRLKSEIITKLFRIK